MSILLSIIVPVYNVGSFLPKCINSIISQTFTDFELILVDGRFNGQTASKYVTPPQKKDSRVRVIHKEKRRRCQCKKKQGLSVAVGKYAGYVDGDDWIDEAYVRNIWLMQWKNIIAIWLCVDVEHEKQVRFRFLSGSTHINISGGYYNREQLENNVFP